ncbi:bifunctional metallophosphatase/5'-nucleotidase [Aliidiomarina taiwanensis]|uniref:Bifunctional metallophosphatase/5'-nucleotidase n=2 Tax=Aliidiomarina taiwanensis TaxID=946228 RepID=A0A432X1B3_9GAMM|nr:bifunctional metallophosphatase/5'-nucleotidase [Aliidiomarina taiwanensis]
MRALRSYFLHAVTLVLVLPLLSACSHPEPTSSRAPFELHIAHINDTHSAFDPIASGFQAPLTNSKLNAYTEFGGHPRLLTRIDTIRRDAEQAGKNLLFLHGGDAWQGSGYFLLNEGRMNADILNRLGLDAMALGNHEFDLDNARLNAFIEQVNFPVLAANLDASGDADLKEQENLRPFVVFAFDEKGQKTPVSQLNQLPEGQQYVGVLGVVLDDMPNIAPNTGDVRFFEMVSSAQATVDTLKAAGVQHIVAVTHIGLGLDQKLASEVNGIDVIVGGHSHTLLGDFTDLNWGNQGEYAQQVVNPNGQTRTCIVQAGQYAQAMGLVKIRFDAAGNVEACDGNNTLLMGERFYTQQTLLPSELFEPTTHADIAQFIQDHKQAKSVAEAPSLRKHIDETYKPALEASYGQLLGFVPKTIMHVRRPGDNGSDAHGSELAPLVAYAQYRWFLRPEVQQVTGRVPDFALVGAGGIRTELQQGELREGNIRLEMLPFASHLSIVSLTGAQVEELLTEVITQTLPLSAHAGKFPYGGNLRYTFEAEGNTGRITQLEVNRGSLHQPDWQPLQADARYQVVTSGYSAAGNDGWHAMYRAQQHHSDRLDVVLEAGAPSVYPVARVAQTEDGKRVTEYQSASPDCQQETTNCAVDALAVIAFLRDEHTCLQALPYPVVTLNR